MKKKYILAAIIIFIIISFTYTFKNTQSKISINIKKFLPDEVKFIMKDVVTFYLSNFNLNINFVKRDSIESSNGKKYLIREYNSKFFNLTGPRAYLGSDDNNLFVVTGTGLVAFSSINDFFNEKNFSLKTVDTNIKDLVTYKDFHYNSSYGVKGILVDKNHIFISIINRTNDIDECYNISILKSKINLDKLNFSYFFKPKECVKKDNIYGEFQALQSGGMLSKFDNNNLLLSIGDLRFRDLAQNDQSIYGKLLTVNKKNGNYKIISKGHRNPQGLHYDSVAKIIVSTDHGPKGGDEVNIDKDIYDKSNFGWPISSYGEHYVEKEETYKKAPLHKSHAKYGFVEPVKYFTPSIGISQIVKAENSFGQYKNHNYFFSSMGYRTGPSSGRINSLSLHQIVFDQDYSNIIYEDRIRLNQRIRDIIFIPEKKIIVGFLEKKGSIIILSDYE